ncbi:MAG: hypothetical protein JRE13_10850, partial [Deltaproteobacteria bacterium]|nr:hypothetical protein [Deltaproteobacteria bacterium]
YAWSLPHVSDALSPEQREILERRGVLEPEEIHRLAGKTRRSMADADAGAGAGAGDEKAACHSDLVDREHAERLQERLDPVTLESITQPPA